MPAGNYEYQYEFVREWVARLQKVREERFLQGFQEGMLEVLDARGLTLDEASRQQILACRDLTQLKIWLRRAVTAQSVHELFESGPEASQSR